jgi:hypothetical protein
LYWLNVLTLFSSIIWSDLEIDKEYLVLSDIQLPALSIPKDSVFKLNDMYGLSGVSVVYYDFTWRNCPDPSADSDLEIFEEVGIDIDPECKVNLFLETKDLMINSFLANKENHEIK